MSTALTVKVYAVDPEVGRQIQNDHKSQAAGLLRNKSTLESPTYFEPGMRLKPTEWQIPQPNQYTSTGPIPYQAQLSQPPQVSEDSSYVYASTNNASIQYQLPSILSASDNNSVIQTPLVASSSYYSHPNDLASNASNQICSESFNQTCEPTNSPSTEPCPRMGTTLANKCTCRSKRKRIPRPRNAFILFRQKYHQSVFGDSSGRKSNSEISKELGNRWRNLLTEEREHWSNLAKEEKDNHAKKYPGYRYSPRKNGKRDCPVCNPKKSQDIRKSSPDTASAVTLGMQIIPMFESSQNPIDISHPSFHPQQMHQPMQQTAAQLVNQAPAENSQVVQRYSFPNLFTPVGQINQMGQTNQMNQMNQPSPMNQSGQASLVNYMNQMNQMNQINQMNQMNQMGQLNPMNPMNPMNSMGQMSQINSMNPMNPMGQSFYLEPPLTNQMMPNSSFQAAYPLQNSQQQLHMQSMPASVSSDKQSTNYEKYYQASNGQAQIESTQQYDSMRDPNGQFNQSSNPNTFPKHYSIQSIDNS